MATRSQNYGLKVCLIFVFFGKFAYSNQLLLSKCPMFLVQWNQLIEMNLQDFCKIGRQFPLQCLPEVVDFRFPLERLKASNGSSIIIINKMLSLLFNFFVNDKPNDIWNSTCIRNIVVSLHQQINKLKKCFNSTEMQKELKYSKVYLLILQIQSYFQRMNDFLKDKQYNSCSWEVIHIEIKNCFLIMNQLLEMLNK